MPYLIYDLVSQSVLDGWVIIGWLIVLLWHTLIEDRESYLVCSISPHWLYKTNVVHPGWSLICNWRLSQHYSTRCTKHFGDEAKVSLFPCSLGDLALLFFTQLSVMSHSTMFSTLLQFIATDKHQARMHAKYLQNRKVWNMLLLVVTGMIL